MVAAVTAVGAEGEDPQGDGQREGKGGRGKTQREGIKREENKRQG